MVTYNLSTLKRERDSSEWFCQAADGSELFVQGTEGAPSAESIADAQVVIEQMEQIKSKATHLLEFFMKDRGTWFFSGFFVGPFASQSEGDLKVELGFESSSNSHEYMYTGFTVHFSLGKKNPPLLRQPHPFRFTVAFS